MRDDVHENTLQSYRKTVSKLLKHGLKGVKYPLKS